MFTADQLKALQGADARAREAARRISPKKKAEMLRRLKELLEKERASGALEALTEPEPSPDSAPSSRGAQGADVTGTFTPERKGAPAPADSKRRYAAARLAESAIYRRYGVRLRLSDEDLAARGAAGEPARVLRLILSSGAAVEEGSDPAEDRKTVARAVAGLRVARQGFSIGEDCEGGRQKIWLLEQLGAGRPAAVLIRPEEQSGPTITVLMTGYSVREDGSVTFRAMGGGLEEGDIPEGRLCRVAEGVTLIAPNDPRGAPSAAPRELLALAVRD